MCILLIFLLDQHVTAVKNCLYWGNKHLSWRSPVILVLSFHLTIWIFSCKGKICQWNHKTGITTGYITRWLRTVCLGLSSNRKGPQANLEEVSNLKFLPTLDDQQRQGSNYIILTSRILVYYFDVLAPLKDACILHIHPSYPPRIHKWDGSEAKEGIFFNV